MSYSVLLSRSFDSSRSNELSSPFTRSLQHLNQKPSPNNSRRILFTFLSYILLSISLRSAELLSME